MPEASYTKIATLGFSRVCDVTSFLFMMSFPASFVPVKVEPASEEIFPHHVVYRVTKKRIQMADESTSTVKEAIKGEETSDCLVCSRHKKQSCYKRFSG